MFEFPVVSVLVICVGSVNAGCIWDALFEQPLMAPVMTLLARLRSMAKRVILVREADAASPGVRCIASELQGLRRAAADSLHVLSNCFLHQANLVVRAALQYNI